METKQQKLKTGREEGGSMAGGDAETHDRPGGLWRFYPRGETEEEYSHTYLQSTLSASQTEETICSCTDF